MNIIGARKGETHKGKGKALYGIEEHPCQTAWAGDSIIVSHLQGEFEGKNCSNEEDVSRA